MRFCKCGTMYKTQCPKCKPHQHKTKRKPRGNTQDRGYGWDHRLASERYRAEHPLCECCLMHGIGTANGATEMHHIEKIAVAPQLRMNWDNWLAVCSKCHESLEDDPQRAKLVKAWSQSNYARVLHGGTVHA